MPMQKWRLEHVLVRFSEAGRATTTSGTSNAVQIGRRRKPNLDKSDFGQYPFQKDGYKLIEVPYSGMEHQSAVTYGNHFANGYLGRDWTGVGISTRFDFIIIHESAHEWFGNSVTAADVSDM
jgi:hypothetical protein